MPTPSLKEIFAEALRRTETAERAAYLASACPDPVTREKIESLLRASEDPDSFLDQAPVEQGAKHFADALEATKDHEAGVAVGAWIAGRYKLLEEIGEGGMGSVWVAEQTEPVHRKVALKLIKPGMDSKQVLARFEAERQALAMMDHPNIAKVFDGGLTETGHPFFVMEYVKGVPITEYCDATRSSVSERLQLFVQVCQAVQHAHQKGVIHRDLKPSNILVAPYDDRPVPKVIDFGLAKAMHQSLTERTLHTAHETVLGTPLYMSPEQAQLNNLDVDTRSDIYSLGVLLYELLTGSTPLEKKRLKEAAWDEVCRIIREEEPQRPSTRLSSTDMLPSLAACRRSEPAGLTKLVRGELDWIVMKALEKDRGRRYETANGFAADVQRYLASEPVQAVPPSTSYRLRKFLRRNKGQVTAAAFVFLALVAGTVAAMIGLFEARRQRDDATVARDEANKARRDADRELKNATKANQALETSQGDLQKANQTLQASQRELRNTLYASRMTLVRNSLEAKENWRAIQLLDLAYPGGGNDDPSGFEWHYLDRKLRGWLAKFPASGLWRNVFSRDGSRCYSNIWGTGNCVVDVATGRFLRKFDGSMEGWKDVKSIQMSPDGKHVATIASGGNTNAERAAKRIQIWNVDSGEREVNVVVEKPFSGETNMCAISPDMRTLVAGVYEPNKWSVKAWDTRTGKELFNRALRPKGVPDFWFNDAGTELLVFQGTLFVRTFLSVTTFPSCRGVSGSVEIWDARTGKRRVALDGPFTDGVASAVISPDGRFVATAAIAYDSDNPLVAKPSQVKLWDAVTGKVVRTMMPLPPLAEKNEQNFNFSLAFSPSGDRLAVGYVRGMVLDKGKFARLDPEHVQVWDVATGEIRWQLTHEDQSHNFITVCFGGKGSLLHVAGSSGTTYDGTRDIRRVTRRTPIRKAIPGMHPVEMICSPSGDQFATLWENDKSEPGVAAKLELRVDDAAGRELLRITDLAEPQRAKNGAEITTEVIGRKVIFSPDGRKIALLITHATGPIKKYNEIIAKFPAVVIYPAGQPPKRPKEIKEELLQGLPRSTVRSGLRVWDLGSGKELHGRQVAVDSPSPRFFPISDAWFTPDGTKLTAIRQRIPGQFQPDQVPELRIEGEISAKDAKDSVRERCYSKMYPYRMEAGKHYRIDHMAKVRDYALDPFLILKDPAGKVVAWDDDGGGYLNSRILYKASVTGTHQIVCTTFDPDMFGRFSLTVVGSSQEELSWGGSRIVTWDIASGQETGSFTRPDELFNHGVYTADGKSMILAGRFDKHYRRVDARTGKDLERIPINLRAGINMNLHEEGFQGRHDAREKSVQPACPCRPKVRASSVRP